MCAIANYLNIGNIVDALVPISRFNRGEANKVFDEVRETGCKIVLKNNTPTCIMLSPERYQEMVDIMDDQYLLAVAEARVKYGSGTTHSAEDVYSELGIGKDDDDEIPMEYGVDFE